MKFIILHGAYGNPDENWFRWLKQELKIRGHAAYTPKMPTPEGQDLENWKSHFRQYEALIDQNTVLIGHSMAPAFILSILEEINTQVRACFFVSGFQAMLENELFDKINKTFMEKEFDWQKIKQNCQKFYLINAKNDPYVPWREGKKLAHKLDGEFILKKEGGHFNMEEGCTQFPELLELIEKEIIK